MIESIWKAVSRMRTRQVAILFALVGFVVFCSGLTSPFQNDDIPQIVDNPVVHSIGNLSTFFSGSTFYDGDGLSGVYYRPLMTTVYAAIYSVAGAQPVAYHVVQLALHITTAVLVCALLSRCMKRPIAIVLALVFLVHPLNSQVVFSIPTMQDALYGLFGVWAIYLLVIHEKGKKYWGIAILLLLSLFAKEAGLLFVVMALIYQALYRRKELMSFVLTLIAPVILYVAMKVGAVGFMPSQHAGPINDISFGQRLLTMPSVALFYLLQLVWPAQLALTRYWTHSSWSLDGVIIPLIVDILLLCLLVWGFMVLRAKRRMVATAYLFFGLWLLIGMAPYLQLLPGLDMTACETWFYMPMIGLLGVAGVTINQISWKRVRKPLQIAGTCLVAILIVALGVRTVVRGFDYVSQTNLARVDLRVESDNYAALNNLAQDYLQKGEYDKAINYAQSSIASFPVSSNYINLGVGLQQTHRYAEAFIAYDHALKYGDTALIYENLALLHIVASKPAVVAQFFHTALQRYPHNFKLWLYDAVFEGALGNHEAAQTSISTAAQYGTVPPVIYQHIMTSTSFTIPILGSQVLIH